MRACVRVWVCVCFVCDTVSSSFARRRLRYSIMTEQCVISSNVAELQWYYPRVVILATRVILLVQPSDTSVNASSRLSSAFGFVSHQNDILAGQLSFCLFVICGAKWQNRCQNGD
ncbi:hypothetical protein NP493_402g01054 [Ridgeia piscesae]|uniref:Secreted protein n=1 Tax=Ridgeia piscesae TaxID=27915 RepID=A0AAD9L114_RIDPI|nr:hypothetical protein NP493_402g01054 [Ridgeia piscesae]